MTILQRYGWAYFAVLAVLGAGFALNGGCTDDTLATSSDSGTDASDAATDTGTDACVAVSVATAGMADNHCAARTIQVTSAASCVLDAGSTDAGDTADASDADGDAADANDADDAEVGTDDASISDAGADADDAADADTDADADAATIACAYGTTMYGQAGDDDACKYHIVWTSPDICESATGVPLSVTVTNKSDGTPVANLPGGLLVETFVSLVDSGCDDQSKHAGPNTGAMLTETPAGSGVYAGPVAFDTAGAWTMRFHIHEECTSGLSDSPRSTAAFHVAVP